MEGLDPQGAATGGPCRGRRLEHHEGGLDVEGLVVALDVGVVMLGHPRAQQLVSAGQPDLDVARSLGGCRQPEIVTPKSETDLDGHF